MIKLMTITLVMLILTSCNLTGKTIVHGKNHKLVWGNPNKNHKWEILYL